MPSSSRDVSGQIDAEGIRRRVRRSTRSSRPASWWRVTDHGNRHREKLELVLKKIRRVNAVQDRLDGFSERKFFIPSFSARPVDEDVAGASPGAGRSRGKNRCVHAQLLTPIASRRTPSDFGSWPAALTVHHAYRGGLLEHVVKLAEVGESSRACLRCRRGSDLCRRGAARYWQARGAILRRATSYSTRGNLIGHITIGVHDGPRRRPHDRRISRATSRRASST